VIPLVLQFVPWRQVSSWRCNGCGDCCRDYGVVLKFPEWLKIVNTFGQEKTVAGLERLYIRRREDGSCSFLCHFAGNYLCGLQGMKPDACKIWPFKVLVEPRYGEPTQACFELAGRRLFVYVDGNCPGLRFGAPSWEFAHGTLREFVELAAGARMVQHKTTGKLARY